ncbi:hypothetical protein DIPPA_32547 [Diplonema papillatum]|nr:hypothetical protein DIPPA_32547 [Diplonema papillatum]
MLRRTACRCCAGDALAKVGRARAELAERKVAAATVAAPVNESTGVEVFEGGGAYYRNTTLAEKLPGFPNRWKHYCGHLVNDAGFPFQFDKRELCRGSWFAVPVLGRRIRRRPLFHVLTANHVVHPFWYPQLYDMSKGSELELLKYYGAHDVDCTLLTATADGKASHFKFESVPDYTYAHESQPLDLCVLHPDPEMSEHIVDMQVFSHATDSGEARIWKDAPEPWEALDEEGVDSFADFRDEARFPFHFQLLSFDCRPVAAGEKVMIHGHALDGSADAAPRMRPAVIRGEIRQVHDGGRTTFLVEPEAELPPGICGGPVLRDGKVVGMLISSLSEHAGPRAGFGVVTAAPAMRDFVLRVEDRWRWPEPPSSNWLLANGHMTGPLTQLPVSVTDATRERVPQRYLPPEYLPEPVTRARLRAFIDRKFNDPLPVDFAPPQLPFPGAPRVAATRDRTNPYNELPADSGTDIPSLPLFPGYPSRDNDHREAAGEINADKQPWWIQRYGTAENYWKAHGLDPAATRIPHFKNYISPAELPGKGWGLLEDRTDEAAEMLLPDAEGNGGERGRALLGEGGAAGGEEAARLTGAAFAGMGGMAAFFGEEEYVEQREARRRGTLALLAERKARALAAGDLAAAAAVDERTRSFVEAENELDMHRGDAPVPHTHDAAALEAGGGGRRYARSRALEGRSARGPVLLSADTDADDAPPATSRQTDEEAPTFDAGPLGGKSGAAGSRDPIMPSADSDEPTTSHESGHAKTGPPSTNADEPTTSHECGHAVSQERAATSVTGLASGRGLLRAGSDAAAVGGPAAASPFESRVERRAREAVERARSQQAPPAPDLSATFDSSFDALARGRDKPVGTPVSVHTKDVPWGAATFSEELQPEPATGPTVDQQPSPAVGEAPGADPAGDDDYDPLHFDSGPDNLISVTSQVTPETLKELRSRASGDPTRRWHEEWESAVEKSPGLDPMGAEAEILRMQKINPPGKQTQRASSCTPRRLPFCARLIRRSTRWRGGRDKPVGTPVSVHTKDVPWGAATVSPKSGNRSQQPSPAVGEDPGADPAGDDDYDPLHFDSGPDNLISVTSQVTPETLKELRSRASGDPTRRWHEEWESAVEKSPGLDPMGAEAEILRMQKINRPKPGSSQQHAFVTGVQRKNEGAGSQGPTPSAQPLARNPPGKQTQRASSCTPRRLPFCARLIRRSTRWRGGRDKPVGTPVSVHTKDVPWGAATVSPKSGNRSQQPSPAVGEDPGADPAGDDDYDPLHFDSGPDNLISVTSQVTPETLKELRSRASGDPTRRWHEEWQSAVEKSPGLDPMGAEAEILRMQKINPPGKQTQRASSCTPRRLPFCARLIRRSTRWRGGRDKPVGTPVSVHTKDVPWGAATVSPKSGNRSQQPSPAVGEDPGADPAGDDDYDPLHFDSGPDNLISVTSQVTPETLKELRSRASGDPTRRWHEEWESAVEKSPGLDPMGAEAEILRMQKINRPKPGSSQQHAFVTGVQRKNEGAGSQGPTPSAQPLARNPPGKQTQRASSCTPRRLPFCARLIRRSTRWRGGRDKPVGTPVSVHTKDVPWGAATVSPKSGNRSQQPSPAVGEDPGADPAGDDDYDPLHFDSGPDNLISVTSQVTPETLKELRSRASGDPTRRWHEEWQSAVEKSPGLDPMGAEAEILRMQKINRPKPGSSQQHAFDRNAA